jgi:hypothetical protein
VSFVQPDRIVGRIAKVARRQFMPIIFDTFQNMLS